MQPWSTIPEAAKLLADCAASPPAMFTRTTRYAVSVDENDFYVMRDPRVKQLHQIRDRFFEEVICPADAKCREGGRYPTGSERDALIAAFPTVEQAIDEAIAAKQVRRAA